MFSRKILLVIKREYLRIVKNKMFWLTTLLFPIFIVAVSLISGLSSASVENKIKEQASSSKLILVLDETLNIKVDSPLLAQAPFSYEPSLDEGIGRIKSGEASAFIYYPKDLLTSKQIKIYAQDTGLLAIGQYDDLAQQLLKQQILTELPDQTQIELFNTSFSSVQQLFKNGVATEVGLEKLIIPGVVVVAYILFTSFATSYMLQSVSEEKENRMIEIMLSIVKPKELIWGKIFALVGVILTQILVLVILAVGSLLLFQKNISIDFSKIAINPIQLIFSLFYLVVGFLFIANIMVGVGAAMPTYKEAQSFSSIFIMLSIFPLYFIMLIVAEPSGPLAIAMSYFPFTAPMILLFRNVLGELSALETILSSLVLLIYVALAFVVSYKLFEFGSLEYSQKISFKSFLKSLRRN